MQVNIGASQTENSLSEKLLAVTIDAKLSLEKYTEQIYIKARAHLKASARIAPFISIQKKNMLMKAFFTAQFSYCALIWMFHIKLTNCMSVVHEKSIAITHHRLKNF